MREAYIRDVDICNKCNQPRFVERCMCVPPVVEMYLCNDCINNFPKNYTLINLTHNNDKYKEFENRRLNYDYR